MNEESPSWPSGDPRISLVRSSVHDLREASSPSQWSRIPTIRLAEVTANGPEVMTSETTEDTDAYMASAESATSSTNPILRASSGPILEASMASLRNPALPRRL